MNKANLLNSKVGAVIALGIVGAIGVWYTKNQAAKALETIGDAINPKSQDNIFNRGVNAMVQTLTGDENQTLGGWIYDDLNGTPQEQALRREEEAFIDRIGG